MNFDSSGIHSTLGYANITEAWADIGYDPKGKTRDPLCSLYNDQFNKVQEALWQSKFPAFEQYAPFEKLDTSRTGDLPAKSVGAPKRKTVKDTEVDEEAILEKYIENGTEPNPVSDKAPTHQATAVDTTSNDEPCPDVPFKAQILQVIMFVAAGLLLIILLDLFFRMGYRFGERSLIP